MAKAPKASKLGDQAKRDLPASSRKSSRSRKQPASVGIEIQKAGPTLPVSKPSNATSVGLSERPVPYGTAQPLIQAIGTCTCDPCD
jgi:hypothetical protein